MARRRHLFHLTSFVVATLLAAACVDSASSTADGSPSTSSSSTATTRPAPVLPPVSPWQPGPGEPAIEVKIAAARAVEAVGTYAPGEGTIDAARSRLVAAGLEAGFADSAAPLLGSGEATVEVVYPQLSGLAPPEAGVMLVADLTRATDEGVDVQRRTLDVRVAGGPGAWRATAIAVDTPAPSAEQPSEASIALADADALDLSIEAAADLRRGAVDDRLVSMLTEWAADGIGLSVSVFSTGHPMNVFATDRPSNHAAGRAVDIWGVDGVAIAAAPEAPRVRELVDRALAAGATEIGAPFDPDGRGGRVFTNTVHEDHLHIAFER